MYKISKENRDTLIQWLTKGEGRNLSYGSVSGVITLLTQLEEIKDDLPKNKKDTSEHK